MNKVSFVLILFVSILLSSCNNEDVIENKIDKQNSLEYGQLHNKALDLFYKKNADISEIDFSEAVTQISSYMKESDPVLFADVDAQEIVNKFNKVKSFSSTSVKSSTDENEYTKLNILLDYLKENNEVSESNYTFIVNKMFVNESYDVKVKSINDYLSTNSISDFDKEQIEIVKSIFISSNEYWNSSNNAKVAANLKSTKSKEQNTARAVIVADAIGALIWSGTGPGAIIAGAALSLIANEG
jgi:hypothetical protein